LLGTLLTLPSPEIAELLARCGFDWLFLDMEHGLLDFTAVQRMVQAAGPSCACIVRVPALDGAAVAKALDTGAAGLIVPHVCTAAEASAAVRWAKYPPVGERSIGVARAQGYGRCLGDAVAHGNDETVVVAQIEHVSALAQVGAIVEVSGVDGIFIGPFDLSASMGRPGDIAAPDVRAAIDALAAASAAGAKPCGIFVTDGQAAHQAFAAGHSLVCAATDTLLLGEAAGQLVARARP
jgi:2-dehydro-3-deoxyglucarate aldolase/4-hydroxy-2-oxoheptanedioate aldolase